MVGGLMLVHHQTRMKWAVVVVGLTIEATIHIGGVVASVGASWRPHHHHQGGGAQHPRRRRRARTRHDILIHGKLVVMRKCTFSACQFDNSLHGH